MKRFWNDLLFVVVIGIIAPGLILSVMLEKRETEAANRLPETQITQPGEKHAVTVPILEADGTLNKMDLDEYLTGVLLGEMPAEFEPEAKKAQAVVARTYALRRFTVSQKHENGAICVSGSCCQAYISPQAYIEQGGSQAAVDAAREAVAATAGMVLCYQGDLAEATYFSCSGGMTEDAVAVWGSDVPYLRSVESPGEEAAAHYTDSITFSTEEFTELLGQELSGDPSGWIGETTYTSGGGVDTMKVGDVRYQGTQLRSLLGLRSTAFTVTTVGDHIIITTKGFGHRVGMSQYGADAMALSGKGFDEILAHYYPGTELADWIDKEGQLG